MATNDCGCHYNDTFMEMSYCSKHAPLKCQICDADASVQGSRTFAGCCRDHSSIANSYGLFDARRDNQPRLKLLCQVCDNPAATNGARIYAGCCPGHSKHANQEKLYYARFVH